MNNHKIEFPVEKMCKVLKVSTSGYYKWIKKEPSKRSLRNEMLKQEIHTVYRVSKGRYGSPRIAKELQMQGMKVSVHLVAKLMQQEHLRSIVKKRFVNTTDSKHNYPVVQNRLNRAFTTQKQNQVWVSDITYIATRHGWTYLTTMIDLFDRKVIGWALSQTMLAAETSVAALKMALNNRPLHPQNNLILHSDRGIQYACNEFVQLTSMYKNIERSMSRKGNCWDNAVAESFFKTLKTEHVYHHKYESRQQAELSIFEYIETFYNTKRRHKHLNNLTILEHQKLINNNLKNAA
jgi:putative transposase